jgi:hypothetical protein
LDVFTTLVVKGPNRATCIVPPNNGGSGMTYVEVTLNNNRKYATDDNIPYYYYKPSRITMIEPSEGPTTGGTTVMVFGIDFMPGKKIICKFDNVNTYGKYINMGQVKCLSPPNQIAGSVQLSISYEGEDDKF